jgi:hypothetical protein
MGGERCSPVIVSVVSSVSRRWAGILPVLALLPLARFLVMAVSSFGHLVLLMGDG